jgi:hypothetical protein
MANSKFDMLVYFFYPIFLRRLTGALYSKGTSCICNRYLELRITQRLHLAIKKVEIEDSFQIFKLKILVNFEKLIIYNEYSVKKTIISWFAATAEYFLTWRLIEILNFKLCLKSLAFWAKYFDLLEE